MKINFTNKTEKEHFSWLDGRNDDFFIVEFLTISRIVGEQRHKSRVYSDNYWGYNINRN